MTTGCVASWAVTSWWGCSATASSWAASPCSWRWASATCSRLSSRARWHCSNNFLLNRHWTFEVGHGQVTRQARNYLLISAVFFAAQLAILHVLVVLGLPKVVAEGLSVLAVVPDELPRPTPSGLPGLVT